MKIRISTRLVNAYTLIIFFIGIAGNNTIYAQCGTETFSVKNWCENGYAEWTITNPDPAAKYHWYEPIYNAAGTAIVDTLDRNYGENTAGTDFVSPYRYTTPTPTPTTPGWDNRTFWYVKEKAATFSLNPPTTENHSAAPTTGYSMNFTSTLETRIDYITVPFFSYYVDPSATWYIQVQIDTKYSAIYYFNSTSLTKVTSNVYLLRVPVGIDTQAGTHVMTIITNPASPTTGTIPIGTDQLSLAMLNTATTFPINNTAGINITGASNGGKSMIYKWETETYCPYTFTPPAQKTTTGCCVPVLSPVSVTGSNTIIVSGTDNSTLTVTGYENTSDYFQWYKDGSILSGKTGLSITVSQAGVYEVREVKSAADVNNVSCYQEGSILIQERSLFAKVDNPKTSYCVGDKATVEAYGTSINNVVWTPTSLVASPNSLITDVTLTTPGTLTFTATADVFLDNPIINGDFEAGNTGFTSDMTNTTGTPSSGQYRIDTYVTEQQSYWATSNPGNPATQTKGTGKFLYSDGFQTYQTGSIIWSETVNVSPDKIYTFSMDDANISWNSDPSNPARVADIDTQFDIYINGVNIATFTTDGQGQYAGVGRWKTDQVTWNSGTATQAVIQIKQKVKGGAGYDFAIDNILFGGPVTQTATVSVGIISDCYAIKDSVGACIGSTRNLYAKAVNTVTGKEVGVIDRWQQLPANTVVGTGKNITVTPTATTKYVVYGYFPSANLIQNGDFQLDYNGFTYGSINGLYNSGTGPGSIGIVTNPKVTTNNPAYASMVDHTTGTGKMLLVDPQGADGNVISYNFTANAGQTYLLSLWTANAVDFTQNPNGISASLSFLINGPGVTNLQITSIDLPRNNTWMQLSAAWTPTTTGAYTLTVRAKGDNTLGPIQSASTGLSISGGNDFVLDDIQLAEPTNKVYTDTVTVASCVSCKIPNTITAMSKRNLLKSDTVCVGSSFTIQKNVIDTTGKASVSGGYYYYWAYTKTYNTPTKAGTGYVRLTAPAKLNAPGGAYADYTKAVSAATDSGYYFLVIQDGPGLTPSCKDSAYVTIRVNKQPTIKGIIAASQDICYGATAVGFTESKASTGSYSEPIKYSWYTTSDTTGTPKLTKQTGTLKTYTPSSTVTQYYVRKDSVSYCPAVLTNYLKVRVNNKPTKTTAMSKRNALTADTVCVGSPFTIQKNVIDTALTPSKSGQGYYYYWAYTKTYNTTTKVGTGYVRLTVPAKLNSVSYADYTKATSVATDSGFYFLVVQDGTGTNASCKDSAVVTLRVNKQPTVKGIIAASQDICYGATAVAFTESKASTGSYSEPVKYTWYTTSDTTGTPKLTKQTGTLKTYTPGSTVTQYYVRKDSVSYCPAVLTNYLKVRVNNKPTKTTAMSKRNSLTADTVCVGSPFTIQKNIIDTTLTPSKSGQGYYYYWAYTKTYNTTTKAGTGYVQLTTPAKLNSVLYADYTKTTSVATDSGYYFLVIQDGTGTNPACKDSAYVTIRINKAPTVKGIIGTNQNICGSTVAPFTEIKASAGSYSEPVKYSWYTTSDSATTTLTKTTITTKGYTPTAPTVTTYYVRKDSVSYCPAVKTNYVAIIVSGVLKPGKIAADTTICKSGKIALRAQDYVTGGLKPYTYAWEIATGTAVNFSTVTGTDTFYVFDNSIAGTQLATGTYYFRRKVTDHGLCGFVYSDTVKVVITDGIIQAQNASDTVKVCSGAQPMLSAAAADASHATNPAALNYQWQIRNGSGIFVNVTIGGTGLSYTVPTVLTSDTMYRRISAAGVSRCDSAIVNFYIKVSKALTGGKLYRDTTICKGGTVTLTSKTDPSGGGGTYGYSWKQSSSKAGLYSTVSSSTNTKGITIANVTDTTYYYREVSDASCGTATQQSDTVQINVYNITPGTTGFLLNKLDTTICAGGDIAIKGLSSPAGGKKPYAYSWQMSSTSPTTGFTAAPGSSITDSFYVWKNSTLSATPGTYYFRRITTDASGCTISAGNVDTINVRDGLSQTILVPDTLITLCYNAVIPLMNPVAPMGGTGTGSIMYQWFLKNGSSFTAVSGATNAGYTPGYAAAQDTFYVRRAAHGSTKCDTAYFPVHIKVYPQVKGGALKNSAKVCLGGTVSLQDSISASGGNPSGSPAYTYSWQISRDGGSTFTSIPGTGASNSYILSSSDLSNLAFRRLASNAVCGTSGVSSDTLYVQVINLTVQINDPGSTCLSSPALSYTATGNDVNSNGGTGMYSWYVNQTLQSETSSNYLYTPTAKGLDTVRVVFKSPYGCKTSAYDTVNITDAMDANIVITGDTVLCFGYPAHFSIKSQNAQGSNPGYAWYVNSNPTVVGTGTTFSSSTLSNGDKVYVKMTSNYGCLLHPAGNPYASNALSMDILPVPNPVISPDTIVICSSEVGGTFASSGTAAGSALQWYLNDKAIPGATATSYYATQSGNYSLSEDNGYCSAPSEHAVLTIIPSPKAYAGADAYVQQGTFVQLQATGGTTGTQYSWTPPTGLNSTTISNPSFKADQTITYVVTLTNTDAVSGKSCKSEAAVTITVVQPIVVPNVITINGDGANDTWHILHIEGYPNATFEIYNRWGNLVWKSTGYEKEWDGTNFRNGELLPDGTYFYIINLHSPIYTDAYTGWVQIVR